MTKQASIVEAVTEEDCVNPLPITITEAGSITSQLYTLLRQTLPVLKNPESVSDARRQGLSEDIRKMLEGEV